MKYLQYQWKTRLVVVLLISIGVSILLMGLDVTPWAQQINLRGYSHGADEGEGPNIPSFLLYVLPFVKELILIGIPLLLTLLWLKLTQVIRRAR
ncbi:MAG: hypothetical protein V7733_17775 [Paraglaciecola polaris]|uniref:hypothetical protein n=1 Tax=Paraglaciecola polaris TaxID=222814 RepID=UPI0030037745